MTRALDELNRQWAAAGRPRLDIGIGISTGDMVAGNIGSDTIMSYTVIGDTVNLGARLESLNKDYGTRIIISEATREALKGRYDIRPLGEVVGEREIASRSQSTRSRHHETSIDGVDRFASACQRLPGPTTPVSSGKIGGAVKRAQQLSDTPHDRRRRAAAWRGGQRARAHALRRGAGRQRPSLCRARRDCARAGQRPSPTCRGPSSCSTPTRSTRLPRPAASCTSRAARLALIQDEAELAGVLGHEIIHVTEQHTIRAIQKSKTIQMGADETLSGNAALFNQLVDNVYLSILENSFGRGEENESDEKGVALANQSWLRAAGAECAS